jgi:DNA-binding NtrC family response regulator
LKDVLYPKDEEFGTLPDINRSPLTVIVAEKYPIARAALAALLSYDGYRVFQAENLNAAVSRINTVQDVAVVLADLDMPGWRTIVRHALRTSEALVIGMEGNHPISEMHDLSERGRCLGLQKPIIYKSLRTTIDENIRVRHVGDFVRNETIPARNKRPASVRKIHPRS